MRLTKENLGWPVEPSFDVPAEVLEHFRPFAARGAARQAKWESQFRAYAKTYPELAAEFQRVVQRQPKEPDRVRVDTANNRWRLT